MASKHKQDIKIKIHFSKKDGSAGTLSLEEFDDLSYLKQISEMSKRVVLQDTADVIFRVFAKAVNGEADLQEVSKKLPCLCNRYLQIFMDFFQQPEIANMLAEYNAATDKHIKRDIRNKVSKLLIPVVENFIDYDHLYFNFSKFKFMYDPNSKLTQTKQATLMIRAQDQGFDSHDKFLMAVFQMYEDNIEKRTEVPRKAYWMLIKDENGNIIGMTFISSKALPDKLVGKNIIGHSGQILDPSVQGQGYVSIIKSVMTDFMYDNMDADVARDALFATTCNEFNENSQGLQYKSGAKPLTDENGAIVVTSGKMHWYATQEDIMGSDIMKQCIERDVSYEVVPGIYYTGQHAYSKALGKSKHVVLHKQFTKGSNYVRA